MKVVLITQRVELVGDYTERRDSLDQRWVLLLHQCGFSPLPVPNHLPTVEALLRKSYIEEMLCGLLLSGGNDLSDYGGEVPERDEVEDFLVYHAMLRNIPLLGICRGMQVIQHYLGQQLTKFSGHVNTRHVVFNETDDVREVNSFHNFGSKSCTYPLIPTHMSSDGLIEGIEHPNHKLKGIMWHPERNQPFDLSDIELIRNFFSR